MKLPIDMTCYLCYNNRVKNCNKVVTNCETNENPMEAFMNKIAIRITGGILIGTMFFCNPDSSALAAPVAGISDMITADNGSKSTAGVSMAMTGCMFEGTGISDNGVPIVRSEYADVAIAQGCYTTWTWFLWTWRNGARPGVSRRISRTGWTMPI